MYFTHKGMKSMTEIELKLMLLRYNMLSKEKAVAIHMYEHAGKSSYYDDKWEECIDEMMRMGDDLRKYGYKFICTGIKAVGETSYSAYKIVPIDENSPPTL